MNGLGRRVKSMNYAWVWVACDILRNRCIEWLNKSRICIESSVSIRPCV